jgi:hypothetical protein
VTGDNYAELWRYHRACADGVHQQDAESSKKYSSIVAHQ